MSDIMTRPSRTHPGREYGVLLSWAPLDEQTGEREVMGGWPNIVAATLQGTQIAQAGGAEFMVMHRDSPADPWRSPNGYTVTETVQRRWGTP